MQIEDRPRRRWLEPLLERALATMPVVVVTGARQTGKTTLVRDLLSDRPRTFVTLDQLDVLDQARRDPDSLVSGNLPITVDEVQRAPDLLLAVKRAVDRARTPGQVILTGSANLALMSGVAESLAGRAVYLELPPFCPLEWCGTLAGGNPIDLLFAVKLDAKAWPRGRGEWLPWLKVGGYPPALKLASEPERDLWFGGYVQTYLERDLRQLTAIGDLPDFQRLMRLAANRVARLLNQAELARDAGLKQPTGHRYLNLLETGYQIVRLPVFAINPTVRVVKAKKLFFNDPGLALFLAGPGAKSDAASGGVQGHWLEQLLMATLLAWRACSPTTRRLSYWRDTRNNEVDFVLEEEDRVVAIEIKASSQVATSDLTGLNEFSDYVGTRAKLVRSVVLYSGQESRVVGKNVVALPFGPLFPKEMSTE